MSNAKIALKPKLKVIGYGLFSTLEDFKRFVLQGEKVYFCAEKETKTMIGTSIQCGEARFSVNIDLEGFNLWEHQEYNMLDCRSHTRIRFKLTKKHNQEEYFNYLLAVVDHLFKKMNIEPQQESFDLYTDAFQA